MRVCALHLHMKLQEKNHIWVVVGEAAGEVRLHLLVMVLQRCSGGENPEWKLLLLETFRVESSLMF